ncbi:MAG: hypothetical protein R3242_07000 [Akkermansiaceae bacterium]|nr:hypothetical protein [Akkermansiaceae bacterium]
MGSLCSCTLGGLNDMLQDEQAKLERQLAEYRKEEIPEIRLSWKQAKRRMLANDISLKRSRARLEELRRQRKSQWREWLPRPSLFISLQSGLREVGDLNGRDVSGSLYAPLQIPNPWTERAKAYRYALAELQAEDSLEILERRQVTGLYRLFHEWAALDNSSQPVNQGSLEVEDEILQALRARERDALDDDKRAMIELRLSRLLNMPGVRVVPKISSLPDVDYSQRRKRLVPGKNYGSLAMRLSSYRIVSALLRAKGIEVLEWRPPRLSVGLPAIYEVQRGESSYIDGSEEINLFGSWSKSFDVTGRTAASIRNAKQQVEFVRESLRLELRNDSYEWHKLNRRYETITTKMEILRGRINRIQISDVGAASDDLERFRQILSELKQLEYMKLMLDIELWSWDDHEWK